MAKAAKTTKSATKEASQEVVEETKTANKVEQEVIEDDGPKPARTRTTATTSKGKPFVKLHNSLTGMTQELPGATADKLISKNPNQFKIVD